MTPTRITALDPGVEQSAAVVFDTTSRRPTSARIMDNASMRRWLLASSDNDGSSLLLIEYTPPYTLAAQNGRSFVPRQVVDTAIWIGRFIECWGRDFELLSRLDVKKHLLGKANGTDSMVSAALYDRYGGSRERALGGRRCQRCHGKGVRGRQRTTCDDCGGSTWRIPPGPLHGFVKDMYAALAVAVTWRERQCIV